MIFIRYDRRVDAIMTADGRRKTVAKIPPGPDGTRTIHRTGTVAVTLAENDGDVPEITVRTKRALLVGLAEAARSQAADVRIPLSRFAAIVGRSAKIAARGLDADVSPLNFLAVQRAGDRTPLPMFDPDCWAGYAAGTVRFPFSQAFLHRMGTIGIPQAVLRVNVRQEPHALLVAAKIFWLFSMNRGRKNQFHLKAKTVLRAFAELNGDGPATDYHFFRRVYAPFLRTLAAIPGGDGKPLPWRLEDEKKDFRNVSEFAERVIIFEPERHLAGRKKSLSGPGINT